MDPRCKGTYGDMKCQVFGNKQMCAVAYPLPSGKRNDIYQALKDFIQDYGAPDSMTMGDAKAQTD